MATGTVLWQAELGAVGLAHPVVTDQLILVGTGDSRVVALPADGCGAALCDPLWTGTGAGGALVAAGDLAYARAVSTIAAFDLGGCGAATCEPLVTVDAGAPWSTAGIVHDGRLIVGTTDGRVVAFGLPG